MPSNTAAWQVAEKKKKFEVKPAEYTHPGEHEIVVKSRAVAINPIDWKVQDPAPYSLNYPTIVGQDVAGEVAEVGSSVTRFKVGDRVLGHAVGMVTKRNCENAFQEYCVLRDNMASPIPSSLSFEAASVIPLGLSTAACGLYEKDALNLEHVPSLSPNPTGQVLIVWGGASSVGSSGIQLGVAAGYEVFTTASEKNFAYVKKLGASQVFDYNRKTVVEELVAALKGKKVAGVLDCIFKNGAFEMCGEVLTRSEGRRFISTVKVWENELPGGVKAKKIYGLSLKDNEVSKIVYEDFLPRALAEGKFIPAPEPEVIGKGLHAIQDGLDAQKKGVSAKKIVITL